MPHVELSLIDSRRLPTPAPVPLDDSLLRWAAVVTHAAEPSLVVDRDSVIVAVSEPCVEMLGCGDGANRPGSRLQDALPHLVGFTDPPHKLDSAEADKIPPLLAISSGALARGLMRVQRPPTGHIRIMDAIATPLWQGKHVVGSLTFFAAV